MRKALKLEGRLFGRLRVVSRAAGLPRGQSAWNCICSCGTVCVKRGTMLNTGRVESCGCIVKERMSAQGMHNHCRRGAETRTWRTWKSMHYRCTPEHKARKYYFDASITVCKRWAAFENFLTDMGERPEGMTLDRKDGSKGYYKRNCRWATPSMQQLNKKSTVRYAYAGERKTLTEWSRDERCVVQYCTLHKRVRVYGFDFEKSLTVRRIK